MKEEIVLNKIEREIISKIREITQKDYIGYSNHKIITGCKYSKNGLKKGCKFTNSSGEKINITLDKEKNMKDCIINCILDYEKQRLNGYNKLIQAKVKKEFDIDLSPAYISKIKKKIGDTNGFK